MFAQRRVWLVPILVLLACTSAAVADEKPCTAHDGGKFYDMSPLKSSKDYEFWSPSGEHFIINVCKPVSNDTWAVNVDRPEDVAGFTRREHGDFSIGDANTTLLVRDGHPLLIMTEGSACPMGSEMTASTAIRFICDTSGYRHVGKPELVAQLPPDDASACAFFIEWRTHVACPTREKGSPWGVLSVLALILAILLTLYIVLGTLYNRYVLGLQGLEQIPRFAFVGDIVEFLRSCAARVKDQSSDAWQSRGDGAAGWGGGVGWGRGAGSDYRGLAGSREEQEAIMGGPPGFLDEEDEEDDHPHESAGDAQSSRPTGMDSDGDNRKLIICGRGKGEIAVDEAQYPMYPSDEDASYGLVYQQPMQQYQVVHPGPAPRQISESDIQQAMQYQRSLNMMPQQPFPPPVYNTSPTHGGLPLSGSPPPPSPNMYGPLSPPISGSDSSADGLYHSRNSSATGSPSSSRANSLVHRHPLRYNPTPSPTSSSAGGRSRGRSLSDDDDGMGFQQNPAEVRKEATRKQRIEAEQRRRDELRDGYARLKDVLPVSNQKSSKVSLLERATNHIVSLEKTNRQLQQRLATLEQEVQRLRSLNEKISLGVGGTPSPDQVNMDARPLSPPPEGSQVSQQHQLASVAGQEPPREESSPSASEGGF
ncbi:hypothetical protein OBBRIDRAFT_731498 [Obba rivulosa]|uniref:Autophagy-related protein 27 n=1 Tax=Obba rivulosa TaxID=1052685 RepID=A0A8E2B0N4_9APHY|nr:hypothetical protein OBBRIDRAFT_731498 [Obba rivulosa]